MKTLLHLLLMVCLMTGLSACQTAPRQGERGKVEVFAVPLKRSQLHENQQVEEKLEIYEQEIRDGRLVNISCVIPDTTAYGGSKAWARFAILPSRGTTAPNDIITINRLPAGDASLREKVFVFNAPVKDARSLTYFSPTYRKGPPSPHDLLCQFGPDGIPAAVVTGIPVQAWALEFSKAERARHRQFSDEDFSSGKVGIGFCSLRDLSGETYYQPSWLFRVPAEMSIQKGDVVEIEFGEVESGGGKGTISTMIRRLGKRQDFPNDGHASIFCK